jgi:hypothetical protein
VLAPLPSPDILKSIRHPAEISFLESLYGATLFCLFSPLPPGDRSRPHPGGARPLLAGQFGLSPSALCPHTKHLARHLDWEQRREDASRQAALLEQLELLDTRLNRLFNSALDLRSRGKALGCVRESLRLHSPKALLERGRLGPGGRP